MANSLTSPARDGPKRSASTSESGQASVELVAVVPLALLVVLVGWQIVLAGQTLWSCAHAARAAARAAAVGRDASAAARSALPSALNAGMRVSRGDAGAVRVEVPLPLILHSWRSPITVAASAGLPRGGS